MFYRNFSSSIAETWSANELHGAMSGFSDTKIDKIKFLSSKHILLQRENHKSK